MKPTLRLHLFLMLVLVFGTSIRVFSQLTVDAGADITACEGSTVVVGKSISGGTGPYKYLWIPGQGLSDSTVLRPLFGPKQATSVLVLRVTDSRNAVAFDTIVVNVKPRPVLDAGGAATQCVGSTVLLGAARTATGGTPPYTFQWGALPSTTVGGASANPSYVAKKTGVYRHILKVTDALGCESLDTAVITIRQSMTVSMPQRAFQTCAYEQRTLGGTGLVSGGASSYTYQWSPSLGLSATSIPNPVAFPDTSVTYYLTVTDEQGCTIDDSVRINVRPRMRFALKREYTVCPGKELKLADSAFVSGGVGPYIYKWTPPTGQTMTDQAIPSPTIIAYGNGRLLYTVRVTDAQGCSILDSIYVNMTGSPGASFASVPKLCMNETYPYGVSGDSSFVYDWIVDGGIIVSGQGSQNIKVYWNKSGTGVIKLNVYDPATGCSKSGQNNTTVLPLPEPKVYNRGLSILCPGSTTTLEAEAGFVRYRWSNGLTTRRITVDQGGNYTCEVQDSSGCRGTSLPVSVVIRPAPLPLISGPSTICSYETIQLSASPGHVSYAWMSGETTPFITVTAPGSFKVFVVDTNGCQGESAEFTVRTIPVKGSASGEIDVPGREILFQYPDSRVEYVNQTEVDIVLDTIALMTANRDLIISSVVVNGSKRSPDSVRGLSVKPQQKILFDLKFDPTYIDTNSYRIIVAVTKPCLDTITILGSVRSYDKTIRGAVSVENTTARPNQIVYIPIQMQFDSELDSIEDATLSFSMTLNGRLVSVLDDTKKAIRKIEDIGNGLRRITFEFEHLTVKYDKPFKLTSLRVLTLASMLLQDTMSVDRGSVVWTQGAVLLKKPIVRLRDGILTVSSFCFPFEFELDPVSLMNVSVTPTPARDFVELSVECGTSQTVLLEVYSLDGRQRMQQDLHLSAGKNNRRVSLNNLENGQYIVVVRSFDRTESKRIVVEK